MTGYDHGRYVAEYVSRRGGDRGTSPHVPSLRSEVLSEGLSCTAEPRGHSGAPRTYQNLADIAEPCEGRFAPSGSGESLFLSVAGLSLRPVSALRRRQMTDGLCRTPRFGGVTFRPLCHACPRPAVSFSSVFAVFFLLRAGRQTAHTKRKGKVACPSDMTIG